MAANTFEQRLEEAADTRRDYRIELLIIGIIAGFVGGWFLFGANRPLASDGYIINVFTELLSVGLTVFVITEINKRNQLRELQKQLIRQAGSVNHQISINAIEELRANSWLAIEDEISLLVGANLFKANLVDALLDHANISGADLSLAKLSGADLRAAKLNNSKLGLADMRNALLMVADLSKTVLVRANMNGAVLFFANLSGADLRYANLENTRFENANLNNADLQFATVRNSNFTNAKLRDANLGAANLTKTDLKEADLSNADLSNADLFEANLRGANLMNANLKGAKFEKTVLDGKTVLPDSNEGSSNEDSNIRYWTPETDMTRYTDPKHSDFWQPNWAKEENG